LLNPFSCWEGVDRGAGVLVTPAALFYWLAPVRLPLNVF
jgi:hypothetical protein